VSSAVFAFERVSVTFGDTAVLRAIDLDVPGSGITAVLGPSGSGKSTLTRLTNRLLDPSGGRVRFRGTDVRELDVLELRRTVGMVFQRSTLFGGTVEENLAATGVTDPASHERILRAVGLTPDLVTRSAATVSGGEAQRICLARALLMEPQVLVADEPTSSLDHDATLALERLVCDLAEGGVPILWVSHDLAQVERIADERVTLDHGRVVRA
jgi:putative ABC transport system ATP-binding protein